MFSFHRDLLLQFYYTCERVVSVVDVVAGVDYIVLAADAVPVVVGVSRSSNNDIVCVDFQIIERSSQSTCYRGK